MKINYVTANKGTLSLYGIPYYICEMDAYQERMKIWQGLGKKRAKKEFKYVRYLIFLASGTLSLLITLHKDNGTKNLCFFDATLVLLGLGILSGSIYLYGEIRHIRLLMKKWEEHIKNTLDGKKVAEYVGVAFPLFYTVCERICFVSLLLSIVLMVLYMVA